MRVAWPVIFFATVASAIFAAESPARPAISVRQGDDGKLANTADATDTKRPWVAWLARR